MADVTNEFFEEDEPLDDIVRAFKEGAKGVTAQGAHGSAYLSVGVASTPAAENAPQGELVKP